MRTGVFSANLFLLRQDSNVIFFLLRGFLSWIQTIMTYDMQKCFDGHHWINLNIGEVNQITKKVPHRNYLNEVRKTALWLATSKDQAPYFWRCILIWVVKPMYRNVLSMT